MPTVNTRVLSNGGSGKAEGIPDAASGSDVCIAEYIQVSHYRLLVAC